MTRAWTTWVAVVVVALVLVTTGVARATTPRQALDQLCGADAIPLEVIGSRHFVRVTLQGPRATETLRFHVDSGGSTLGLFLQQAAAERLGFADDAKLPRDQLRIGARDVKLPVGTRWSIGDAHDPRHERTWDGQLGAGLLSRMLVCIDPARGRLGLAPADALAIADDGTALPLVAGRAGDPPLAYPFVAARIGGEKLLLLVDTGATSSMLERGYIDRLTAAHRDWPLVVGAAGDADMLAGLRVEELLRTSSLTVAGRELGPALWVERPDGTWPRMFGLDEAHGAIANDVLDRYALLFDHAHGRLWLFPTGRAADASASLTRVGVSLGFGGDGCPVVRGLSRSAGGAVTSGLALDDAILAVDGVDVCDGIHGHVSQRLAGAPGTTKRLHLRRQGQLIDVRVAVRDLLAR